MATHSTILTWKILCAEEPGGLSTMGSQRTGHNPVTKHTNEHVTLPTMWASHLGRGRSITKSQQMMVACGDICLWSHSDSEPEQCRDTTPAPPTTETVRKAFWFFKPLSSDVIGCTEKGWYWYYMESCLYTHTHTHMHIDFFFSLNIFPVLDVFWLLLLLIFLYHSFQLFHGVRYNLFLC